MLMINSEFFELHFLPFGSVVEAEFDGHKIKLMIVDWSVHDEEEHFDYLGVPWPRGFVAGKTYGETAIKIPFMAAMISEVLFFGPTDEGFAERDNQAFEVAKNNNQKIAQMFDEGVLKPLKISSDGGDAEDDRSLGIIEREGASGDLLPIGTVAVIDFPDSKGETSELEVMTTSLIPNYRDGSFDYEVMPFRTGYCSVDFPLALSEQHLKAVKSLGFIDAEVQMLVSSETIENLRGA